VIPLLDRRAVRAIDADAAGRLSVPGLTLMENAGRGAFETIRAAFPDALARVVVVGGPGQNGGDGWVVARHLVCAGWKPCAVLVGDRAKLRGDALINFQALQSLGVDFYAVQNGEFSELDGALSRASLVVDALFGTGLDRAIGGSYAAVVERINACRVPVIALDLPSGIDADTGAVLGVAVRAKLTITFAAHKRGLHQYPGAAHAGELHCVGIGVPAPETADVGLMEARDVSAWIPARKHDAHKGDAGHVLVVAGSPGRTGAALLSGLGALRSGAGLCTILGRGEVRAALDAKVIELMTAELPEDAAAGVTRAIEFADDKTSAVVGPGLGLDEDARKLALGLAIELPLPTVLDADALSALGQDCGALRGAAGPRVLTPHPGEAGRLLGISSAEVQADRYAAAMRIAVKTGAVVVLKGARTIIAEPGGGMRVCPTGTPAMAVAGTGDVLAGVIAALLGQARAFDAASAAVYVHGLAGELAARGDSGLLASELAQHVPDAWVRCRHRA